MAKNRFSSKKSPKKGGRKKAAAKHRHLTKHQKRVLAGKKAWRTKVRRFGSKAAAIAASFGHRHVSPLSRGRKRSASHRPGGMRSRYEAQFLRKIQENYGTVGRAPTAAEKRLARIAVVRTLGPGLGATRPMDPETAARLELREKIAREKRALAERIVSYERSAKAEQERAAAAKKTAEEYEAQVKAAMNSL